MTITAFIQKLKQQPRQLDFSDTMSTIEANYTFTETKFTNGTAVNEAGQNSGSCKLFAFAKLQKLSQEETLYCFGKYYQDVLATPQGEDHQNIRNFIKTGWDGVVFEKDPLIAK